jgi:bifunctional non-homologous end joining protein LigD
VTGGNVTIPANHSIPDHGAVVEVRYLYAFKESGCLYQPVFLGVRDDILPTECVAEQLKFKNDEGSRE